jgi:hypothetical protein
MKYGWKEVIDLSIYDENGRFVTKLDSLKNSYIGFKDGKGIVKVQDALFDLYLIAFLGKYQNDKRSDFEREIENKPSYDTYSLNINSKRKCKLIGTTSFRRETDFKDVVVKFEIPNATTKNSLHFSNENDVTPFDIVFEFEPFNDEGDILKLHIENIDGLNADRVVESFWTKAKQEIQDSKSIIN